VPLQRGGEAWGALGFVFAPPRPFSAAERAFLGSLARHCLDALGRARLHEAERRGRRLAEGAAARLERMQRVTAALSRAPGLSEVAAVVVREGGAGLGASACLVAVCDEGGAPRLTAESGTSAARIERARREFLERRLPEVLRSGEPVWPEDDPGEGGVALACVPMIVDGRPLGALGFQLARDRRRKRQDRSFMSALGHLCAQAIERARLYEAERAARERAEAARAEAEAAAQREGQAGVLVADIGMPGQDGYALLRQVRSRLRDRGPLPALALTAYARPEDTAAALSAGYQRHLAKPVEPGLLVDGVAELARGSGAPAAPREGGSPPRCPPPGGAHQGARQGRSPTTLG
jgi:GAF domain-containing protein